MAQFDKTFPTLDCAACILTPRMVAAGAHPNITLHTWSEVTDVSGYVGNFEVKVLHRPRYVDTDACTGCGICEEKCPAVVVDTDFQAGLGYRKAIYRPFPQAVPKYPVLDPDACIYFENGKCRACEKLCPPQAIRLDQEPEEITLKVGNIVLATGFEAFDARRIEQYGYGRLANVFTSLEFERMSNASGPTGGRIVLRDGVTEPRAGGDHPLRRQSRPELQQLLLGDLLHAEHEVRPPGARAHRRRRLRVLHRHPRAGQGASTSSTSASRPRARSSSAAGWPRSPTSLHWPEEAAEDGRLIIQAEDTLAGRQRRIPVDMVVLSVGLEPQADAHEVARRFGITCSSDGWVIERHPKLDPVATMTEGVFAAGCALGPRDIPASVTSGSAAAARILGRIAQGEMALEPLAAVVDADKCSGCRICNDLCPFSAITFDELRAVTEINPALCQGCGVCAPRPARPGRSAPPGFTNDEILSQIEGLLADRTAVAA